MSIIVTLCHCFCQCKDTNSKAIHNDRASHAFFLTIVFANAKILIRKQFTTRSAWMVRQRYCFCQCKDTNSKAIHNCRILWKDYNNIVFANAKILIRKQFTTYHVGVKRGLHCFCQCKDTNSKAIHNLWVIIVQIPIIVFANAKILIRKQFTTSWC